jgi:non-specific serine/threonine protein kinase
LIGQTVSHYRILEELGGGGMGVVYKAEDTKLGRQVALKFLGEELSRDAEAIKRFQREARAASSLNHPNICTIYEFDEHEGRQFIVMELMEGQTLKDRIGGKALKEEEIAALGAQICEGLQAAHERGIIHRDIKPANLFVGERGQVKVLDFGVVKLLPREDDATATGTQTIGGPALGTLAYMAPEQLNREKVDARTDIYALGCVLYEMATGQRPFPKEFGAQMIASILSRAPEAPSRLNPAVPAWLDEIILKCLEKKPEKRYQSARELRVALGAEAPPSSETTGVALGPRRRRRARRKRIQSLAVLPLENLSGDPEQDYLADGVHEALITDLGKLSAFRRVIARASVTRYRKSEKPLAQIARELGVDAVITGSVLRSGDRVQVSAHLVNPATEEQIWGDRFERELRDVLLLENEIVSAISRGIQLKLTPEEQQQLAGRTPVNPEAYEAYLKGEFHLNKFTPEGFERGLAYLHQALDKDPANPLAYSQLAVAYSMVGHDIIPDAFIQAKTAAHKALELDSNSAEAYEVLAEIKLYSDWDDWPGAEQNFKQALALNPNLAMAHRNYSWYLNLMGRNEEGIAEMKRAVEIDPMAPLFHEDLGWQYWDLGQTDKAIEEARKALAVDSNFPYALLLLAMVQGEGGMYTEAIAAAQKLAQVEPDLRWALAMSYARARRPEMALRVVAEIKKQPSPWADWGLAEVYAMLGDREESLRWLEQAFQDRFSLMPWLRLTDAGLVRPFKPFRSDPRYQDLLRRMNLLQEHGGTGLNGSARQ